MFSTLFSPLSIKGLTLRNRIVSTPHSDGMAEGGLVTDRLVAYFRAKAVGGAGLVMGPAGCAVHPTSPTRAGGLELYRAEAAPGLARLVETVHAAGAAYIPQLTHWGRRGNSGDRPEPLLAPSAIPEPVSGENPRALSEDEIADIVAGYAETARRVEAAGGDGVDIVAFANHLPDQFWSPLSNRRGDRYGGSLENRMRFSLELLTAIRRAVGRSFIVGLRISGDEFIEGGLGPGDLQEIAGRLAASGLLDYLSVSGGAGMTPWAQAAVVPGHWWPQGCYAGYAKAMREIAGGIPILYAGRVVRPEMAERLLADGACDLVAMTRAILADPELPNKARAGRLGEIRYCVGANVCIGRRYGHYQPVACIYNPSAGREREMEPLSPARPARRIVVVGGGPAGLEVARVAAERGHLVILFEAATELGGHVRLEAAIPHRHELRGIPDYYRRELERLGVDMRLGAAAVADTVRAERPDAVVVATGSRAALPETPLDGLPVVTADDVLAGHRLAGRILVFDDDGRYRGPGAALLLARQGAAVEIVTPDLHVGSRLDPSNLVPFYRHLFEAGVTLTPNHELSGGAGGLVRLRNAFTRAEVERASVDALVVALLRRVPRDGLYHELKDTIESHLVGDASAARATDQVILEAAMLARRL
ncbi:MAG TPA: FAD-dependent oxidoreductase [Methylomirabilota bacterium]|jgi:2,4-dienoyl-CoA reductase-like NADH-dependent reductase (Old Yellow Enzyme family)|nr:FAD-dependent oxidoreductase [Methylomirabilota bacterium]